MKKVLIWIGCFLGLVLINAFLFARGIKLGSIPSFVILFILPQYFCKKLDIKTVEKEAFSKGMSIRQYVESVVPSALIDFCEAHKSEKSLIKENIKTVEEECIEAREPIPKRIWVVLLEMYK